MAGADKNRITEQLKANGWREETDNLLSPPPNFFDKAKPLTFHCYDAMELENLLGEGIDG